MDALGTLIVVTLTLGGALLIWVNSLRARELASSAARAACRRHEVQLLDDTVALSRVQVVGAGGARLGLRRIYTFDFSTDGNVRLRGNVVLNGRYLESIHFPQMPGN